MIDAKTGTIAEQLGEAKTIDELQHKTVIAAHDVVTQLDETRGDEEDTQ